MKLEHRFHILIGISLILSFLIFATLDYRKEKAEVEDNMQLSAERVRDVLMATRRVYDHQFIDSGLPLNKNTIGFLPAHALSRISRDIENWDKTGFSFNNVSDRPRDPAQRADAVEMEAIDYFRKNPKDEARFKLISAPDGEPYYLYARPIWIEKYCLQCHGEKAAAPETIRDLSDAAYDYKVGELRGILSIKIPARTMQAQLERRFFFTLMWTGTALILLWFAVGFVVRRDILRPLSLLQASINRLARGRLSGRIRTLSGEFGDIGDAFNIMADSLEQKQALLSSSEERFRLLATTATDAIILVDIEGNVVFWNEGAERLFGYAQEDIIGKSTALLVPERFLEENKTVMERIQLGEPGDHLGRSIELTGLSREGVEIPVEISLNMWESEGVRYFVAIIRDIRSRKEAELAMVRERTRLETILRTASDGIHILDADGLLIEANDSFLRMVGQDKTAIRNLHVIDWDAQDKWEIIRARDNALINTKGSTVFDTRYKRSDGKIIDVEISACGIELDGKGYLYAASRDITERKLSEEKIKHLAFYDPLTQLPNRRLLLDRLQQALASGLRSGKKGALLFIDLDNFKTLNDTLGHDIGDLLLQQVAQRLESCIRESDTVARVGGDEFVVLLEGLSEVELEAAKQTEAVGNKILASLAQAYQLATHEHHSTPSIGVTLLNNNQCAIDELFKQADIAMYQAKKVGRNNMLFFDPHMQESINARAVLESELRKALESDQFQLYYQIQVDCFLADGSIRPLGAEALIRWKHPTRGLVPPAQFIPLAEESGLILSIGQWVLETACTQLKLWEQNKITSELVLAVNVSAAQFRQTDFVSYMQELVTKHAVNPKLLKLELTEGLLLDDIDGTIAVMIALKKVGFQFSLDDFGTGYSSLQYLKQLPLDQLKIDQSFVRDLVFDTSDKAIVKTIIAMANSLNLKLIAEGVETEDQRQLLFNKGCSHYQGYLFSRPLPIEEFEALLTQSNLFHP
jgi:diguanylate cyclase (GGDEF)-like protein/PAS domain S-box-containing protein